MGKLAQIAKTSRNNVIFFKKEKYKNKEIASRLGLSEVSVSRILRQNKENLTLSPMKKVPGFGKQHHKQTKKSENFSEKNFFCHQQI